MICGPCRQGGEAHQGNYYLLAVELHGMCEAPTTCPCHHAVGIDYKNNTEAQSK